jgi:diacylglycerol kinase family enzyme
VEIDGRVAFSGSATTVLIANGQFLRGNDVVPRGHPGDGRVEVHVYALAPAERRGMRRRIPAGDHLPHPRIRTFSSKSVTVTTSRPLGLELDGHRAGRSQGITVEVLPGACRLLV